MLPIPFIVEGRAGPKTIVFLHGFGACREIWRDVMTSLATEARVLAYDLPGHGHSLECEGMGGAKPAAFA